MRRRRRVQGWEETLFDSHEFANRRVRSSRIKQCRVFSIREYMLSHHRAENTTYDRVVVQVAWKSSETSRCVAVCLLMRERT